MGAPLADARRARTQKKASPRKKTTKRTTKRAPAKPPPSEPTISATPGALGKRAQKLWDDITGVYVLRPDELRILDDACREVELIDRLECALVDGSLTTSGSQGQTVAHPLVQEVRQHRTALKQLLTCLALPDDPGEAGGEGERSASGRALAMARWRRGA